MILIGSTAMRLVAPKLIERTPSDTDYIASPEEIVKEISSGYFNVDPLSRFNKTILHDYQTGGHFEYEHILPGSTAEWFEKLVEEDPDTTTSFYGLKVPSLDLLFTLKKSHRYLKNSPHFWKTAQDYHKMKAAGAKVRPEHQKFFKAREKETYAYKHPSLKQNKEGFFADDGLQYVWDHDTIHKAVAVYNRPAYTYYIKDGAEVDCDKEKFFSQPLQIQLAGVIEEASVLAIERSLVPHPGVKTPKEAWLFALSKVCSSITSGWFREFAYEHLPFIVKLYPDGYWERFQEAIENGLVIPYTGSKYAKETASAV